MTGTLEAKTARTVIAAEAGTVRQMLADSVRGLGFLDVTVLASGQDILGFLEVEDCDWLVLPLMPNSPVNALQILRVISQNARLSKVRTSLLYDVQEDAVLPAAFALGLMSCHPKSYLRDDVTSEFGRLRETLKQNAWKDSLGAAAYLRKQLVKAKQFKAMVGLEQNLLSLFPGAASLLLHLGEAQILSSATKEGLSTLHQASMLDENVKEAAESLSTRLLNTKVFSAQGGPGQNVLGMETCVLVDPDSAVLKALKDFLTGAGVAHVEAFDNGTSAWEWLKEHPEPDLILQEWRIPGLSGPMLLQRIRQHGFIKVPINVISSIIKPKEVHLLREMGVDDVLAKPFSRQTFFKSTIWTLQQNISPTERGSLERRIGRLLGAGQFAEAERLKSVFLADTRIPTAAKKLVQAEFAFHYEKYREACDLGIESLRLAGDSLRLLNLIGKSLIKLGDNAAALKFFEKAHALSPLNVEHLCNLAVCQFDGGDAKAAATTVQAAKQLDSKNELVGQTECQLAILGGQTGKARELMEQLSSVSKIVAYMNNRAVALSRCGRYEDGIKLYQQTGDALPGTWGATHDVVAYNLGLAYAKYGELTLAAETLHKVLKRPDSPVLRKSQALLKRVVHASETGTALNLLESTGAADGSAAAGDTPKGSSDAATTAAAQQAAVAAALEVRRGELCLYGIFQNEAQDTQSQPLLAKEPRFVERAAIGRPEVMTKIKPG